MGHQMGFPPLGQNLLGVSCNNGHPQLEPHCTLVVIFSTAAEVGEARESVQTLKASSTTISCEPLSLAMLAAAQRQRLMVLHTATSSSHIIYSTFVLGWVQAIAVVLMLNIRLAFTAEVTLW